MSNLIDTDRLAEAFREAAQELFEEIADADLTDEEIAERRAVALSLSAISVVFKDFSPKIELIN